MNCQHCGTQVSLDRADSEYCSVEHRAIHLEELSSLNMAVSVDRGPAPEPARRSETRRGAGGFLAYEFRPTARAGSLEAENFLPLIAFERPVWIPRLGVNTLTEADGSNAEESVPLASEFLQAGLAPEPAPSPSTSAHTAPAVLEFSARVNLRTSEEEPHREVPSQPEERAPKACEFLPAGLAPEPTPCASTPVRTPPAAIQFPAQMNLGASAEELHPAPETCKFVEAGLAPAAARSAAATVQSAPLQFSAALCGQANTEEVHPAPPLEEAPPAPLQIVAEAEPLSVKFSFRKRLWCFVLCSSVAVPLMAATVAYGPRMGGFGWPALREMIRTRASVELDVDFREGLRQWTGSDGWWESWDYDTTGFARPGRLAIYGKSVPLTDYSMEFLGQIDRKALGFAFRAIDSNNYYAAQLTILKPGPIPEVVLERYAVIGGQAGSKTEVRLPFPVRMDTMYRVRVEAQGDHFVITVNGQYVDSFSDSRLRSGGAGFFSGAGEASRICSLHIADQDDALGKLCTLIAPRIAQ